MAGTRTGRAILAAFLAVFLARVPAGCGGDSQDASDPGAKPQAVAVGSGTGPESAADELKAALRVGNPVDRSAVLSASLAALGPESLEPVREFLQANLTRFHPLDAGLIFQWWAQYEPRVSLEWLGEHDKLYDVGLFHRIALGTWASHDFDAATQYLEEEVAFFESRDRVVRKASLLQAGYDSGSPELMPYALELSPGVDRSRLIRGLVQRKFFFEGPDAVLAWAESISPVQHPRFKLEVNRWIGRELGAVDPARAMSWASRLYDGDYGDSVLKYVTRSLVLDGAGPEAMEWLSQLPPGEHVTDAVSETYRYWRKWDLEAATAWIEAAPVEPWLEPAFAKYVLSRTATHGRETGLALAEKLQNRELRHDTLALIGRAWFHQDPDAARSWAEGQDFDDERMRMIVAPPEILFVPPPNKSSRVAPGGEGSGTNPP